jgi:hypothetical protein
LVFFGCSSLRNVAADAAASFEGALALIAARGVHGAYVLFSGAGLLTMLLKQLQRSPCLLPLETAVVHLEGAALRC